MNLLITGAWREAKAHMAELEAMGHSVAFLQQEADPLPCDPAWIEGVVCNGLFLYHRLEALPRLRFLQLTSAGFDRIPLEEARRRGITVCNARGVYSAPMAELAICGVLQLCKQSRFFYENQKARRWEKHRGLMELSSRQVTVLGCGSVGAACARRFSAFDCRVIGVDLYPREDPCFARMAPLSELDALLPETDVLVLTLPLTDETRGLLNAARLAALKSGAILVNIARGPVAEEAALAEALASGRLGGAVLDVFETEPLPQDSPLWAMENVILTPHNSFVGDRTAARLWDTIRHNLRGFDPA